MAVCQSGQPIPDSTFCRRFSESVRMMACVICAHWEASHCIACVTASTSHGHLGGRDSVGSTVCVYSPSTLPDRDQSLVTEPSVQIISCGLLLASTRICTSAVGFSNLNWPFTAVCAYRFSNSRVL